MIFFKVIKNIYISRYIWGLNVLKTEDVPDQKNVGFILLHAYMKLQKIWLYELFAKYTHMLLVTPLCSATVIIQRYKDAQKPF